VPSPGIAGAASVDAEGLLDAVDADEIGPGREGPSRRTFSSTDASTWMQATPHLRSVAIVTVTVLPERLWVVPASVSHPSRR
jgi:hypothetical protein